MKLLSLHQSPTRQQAMFFRHSWFGAAVVLIAVLGVAAAMIKGYTSGKVPLVALLAVGLGGVLAVLLTTSMLRRAFQPTNWLFALGPDRLWIKYRSYLKSHFPAEDFQIVEFRYDEIESVGLIRRVEKVPGQKGRTTTKFSRHLEIVAHHPFGVELSEALQLERSKKDSTASRIKSQSAHYPVQLKDDKTLRMCVTDIRPGQKTALGELKIHRIAVVAEKRESDDFTKPLKDKQEMEGRIVALVEKGDTVSAVHLVRQHYGMGLTEAKQFIDELSAR